MKAFAYLRVSGKGQVEGDGFPRQLEAIEKYAASSDIEIEGVYRDDVTGTAGGPDRPAWVDMVAAILNNGVRTIIVEKLDRLARQQGLQEYMLYDMQKRGISVLSTHEDDLDTDDPTRVLFRQLMGGIAQYEKSMIVLKLRGARRRVRAATGRCEGRKPYGSKDGEVGTLSLMHELRRGGATIQSIADHLNASGVPTRGGESWKVGTISQILGRTA